MFTEYLNILDSLSRLSIKSKEALLEHITLKKVAKGDILLNHGEICRHIYFLNKGFIRIFYFKNDETPEYYIGSADTMNRNLEHRVEVLAPVEEPELQTGLRGIIDTLLSDEYSIWQMNSDGSYTRLQGKQEDGEGSQQALIRQAQERIRDATRLKRRKPQAARRRNIHLRSR